MQNRLTEQQVRQLLTPIHPSRVLRDPRGNNHVSQQDVTAHLIRVFGFGNFETEVTEVRCVFEEPRANRDTGVLTGRWDVCYLARVRLTVKNPDGTYLTSFEDGSTHTAQNLARGDAHDNAYKSALSLAKKRAAVNLGDNFGLSLYNKGQMSALVMGTLVKPEPEEVVTNGAGETIPQEESEQKDLQDGVPVQVSMGNDETLVEGQSNYEAAQALEAINTATLDSQLRVIWRDSAASNILDATFEDGDSVAAKITAKRAELSERAEGS